MAQPEKTNPPKKGTKARPIKSQQRTRSDAPARAGRALAAKRRVPAAPETLPIFGGRFYVAFGLVAVTAIVPMWTQLGQAMAPRDPPPTDTSGWQTGNTTSMRITLITADINLLSCASDTVIENRHCEYKGSKTPWPAAEGEALDDNKRLRIQPYRTWPDNRLILIAGLWAEPHVAMRLHREPPRGVPDKKLSRFVTDCRMRFIGEIDSPKLRWGATGDFNAENGSVRVAVAESCTVVTEF